MEVENNKRAFRYCGNQTGKEVYIGGDYAVFGFNSFEAIEQKGYVIKLSTDRPGK